MHSNLDLNDATPDYILTFEISTEYNKALIFFLGYKAYTLRKHWLDYLMYVTISQTKPSAKLKI